MFKRIFKILKRLIIVILLLIIALWFVVKIPAVQHWLGQKITERLSRDLGTPVRLKGLSFSLFDRVNIEGLYIEDKNKDTLLYAGAAKTNITNWFFLKKKATLSFITLEDFLIDVNRTDSVWNYQFIVDKYFAKDTIKKSKTGGSIDFMLEYITLKKGTIRQTDEWYGSNKTIQLKELAITQRKIDLAAKVIDLAQIEITDPVYNSYDYEGKRPPRPKTNKPPGEVTKHWELFGWHLIIDKLVATNATVNLNRKTERAVHDYFDPAHIYISKANTTIENLRWINDTVTLKLKLAANERSGFKLQKLFAHVKAYPNTIEFNNLELQTPTTDISERLAFSFNDFNKDVSRFIYNMNMKADFINSIIDPKDIAYFAPSITKVLKEPVMLKGTFAGTVADFSLTNAIVRSGGNVVTGNLSMRGLPKIDSTRIQLKNGTILTSANGIAEFAPAINNVKGAQLNQLGGITYKGDFDGYYNDFILNGDATSSLGSVSATNLALNIKNSQQPIYSGGINTNKFKLGTLLGDNKIGTITYNGNIKGSGFDIAKLNTQVNGISSFEYNGYNYQNITTNGNLANKRYNGIVSINDPNFKGSIDGIIDFSQPKFKVDALMQVDKSDLRKLKILNDDIDIKGLLDLNFTASNLDDFDGSITLKNGTVRRNGQILPFNKLALVNKPTANGNLLQLNNDELDAFVNGRYKLGDLPNAFLFFLNKHYPNIFEKPKKVNFNQNFDFELNTRNVEQYLPLLDKNLKGINNSVLKGNMNLQTQIANFEGNIPNLRYQNYGADDINLIANSNNGFLVVDVQASQFAIRDSLTFSNPLIHIENQNNETVFNVQSVSNQAVNAFTANGKLTILNNGLMLQFEPSSFTVNEKVWELQRNGELVVENGLVNAKNLRFAHNNQEIAIRTELIDSTQKRDVIADISNLEIGDFLPLFVKKVNATGKLNGSVRVIDPVGNFLLSANTTITDAVFNDELLGKLDITAKYNSLTQNVDYSVNSKNEHYNFLADGHYYPKDTVGFPIYNKLDIKEANLKLIEPYVKGILSNVSGKANGEIELYGNTKDQFLTGAVQVKDTMAFLVNYTNVKYYAVQPTFDFKIGEIEFTGTELYDTTKNVAYVKKGKILHTGFFNNLGLDLALSSGKLQLLNTTRAENNVFWGKAVGDVDFKLRGSVDNELKMTVNSTNPGFAQVYLNTSSSGRTLGKADFVDFKQYGVDQGKYKPKINTSFVLDVNINANPNAEVNVILDEQAGDNIRAYGNGLVNIKMEDDELKLYGDYTVARGSYDFNLNLYRKQFAIDKNSKISWSGDPYKALIDIKAKYKTRQINLRDFDIQIQPNDPKSVADLDVVALLTGQLLKPKIDFEIRYPENSDVKKPEIENLFNSLKENQSALNTQVAFLVLFSKLLPYSTSGTPAGGASSNIGGNVVSEVYTTISGLIAAEATSKLNELLASKFGDKIKVNLDLRTYSINQADATNIVPERGLGSLNLSWTNNRISFQVSGNFDFSLYRSANQSFSLLPNFIMEYKITPSGTLVGTIFVRNSTDVFNNTITSGNGGARRNQWVAGGGLAWRRESNDALESLGFRRKQKAKNQ